MAKQEATAKVEPKVEAPPKAEAKSKTTVTIGHKDDPTTQEPLKFDTKLLHKSPGGYYQGLAAPFKGHKLPGEIDDDDPPVLPVKVLNRHNHPFELSYGSDSVMLSPKGVLVFNNANKLGALPRGVFMVPYPEHANRPKPR